MDARARRRFQRPPARLDIALGRPAERRHAALLYHLGHRLHRSQVARTRGGEARLHDIHSQAFQLAGYLDLFSYIHAAAGSLLPVP